MKRVTRPWFGILLCLMLALTGQSMVVARGASAATGQMVICTGNGVVTVYADADGQPTTAPHICPECAFAGMAGLDVAAVVDLPIEGGHRPYLVAPSGPAHTSLLSHPYQSRAPPSV